MMHTADWRVNYGTPHAESRWTRRTGHRTLLLGITGPILGAIAITATATIVVERSRGRPASLAIQLAGLSVALAGANPGGPEALSRRADRDDRLVRPLAFAVAAASSTRSC
jgi:hypothetical protein